MVICNKFSAIREGNSVTSPMKVRSFHLVMQECFDSLADLSAGSSEAELSGGQRDYFRPVDGTYASNNAYCCIDDLLGRDVLNSYIGRGLRVSIHNVFRLKIVELDIGVDWNCGLQIKGLRRRQLKRRQNPPNLQFRISNPIR